MFNGSKMGVTTVCTLKMEGKLNILLFDLSEGKNKRQKASAVMCVKLLAMFHNQF